ncbi:MAG: glycosyltransferase [Syntrophobacteraceae bacterium]|jgi:glycosyltransferase involved in cell wall biosynthesis
MSIREYRRDSPLLIAQVDSTQDEATGDFYYRTFAPGVGMAHCEGVHVVNLIYYHRLRHELMLDADVLVLNNICDADLLPVIRYRKARGKLTVYELCDDLEALPATSPMQAFYRQSNNLLLIKRLAHYCDALQFSSPELKRKYGYLNHKCCVFPNQVLIAPPERTQKPQETVTVGWGGSVGHLHDMAKISDRLIHWIMSRDGVRLYLMCADSIWELFEALPGDRKRRFATGSLDDYYSFVSLLDIGIAPLEDTPFNRSRSDVKFLEYAAHGVVPVLQATGPYLPSVKQGRTGFFFNTPDELISTLDHLVSDASVRVSVSASAREYVLRERHYLDRGKDRVEFYRSLLPAKHLLSWTDQGEREEDRIIAAGEKGCEHPGGRAANTFERLCKCAGAKKTGRHLLLSSTRYELLLQAGILASDPSNPSKAWRMFREAMEIETSIYMPYLFGAFVSRDPIRTLKRALQRNPRSIVSSIHLGKAYLSKGMLTEAIESFKAAADIFPEYELPYIECAGCLHKMGLERDATALLKKAIDLIPKAIREPQGL